MESLIIVIVAGLTIGIVVGMLAGMLGIGGGLVIVPVLMWLLSSILMVPVSETIIVAIATSLSTIVFTGISSARAHYKLGNLKRSIVIWCGLGTAFGAVLGAQIASRLPVDILNGVFALLVLAIAVYMMFGTRKASSKPMTKSRLTSVGLGAGSISALMGIGGGAVLVPALVWYQVNMRQAIGCAAFSGIIIALFGSATFVISGWHYNSIAAGFLGYIYWPAALSIAITSVIFAPLGAKAGQKMNTQRLKKVFAVFLVLVSIRMLWGL